MKTRYRIFIIIGITIVSILFIPPNIAAFSCNTLNIKDLHCHVVGMTLFGIPFKTSIYHWFEWNDSINCGGVLAHPGKMYPCIGIEDYWGFPEKISPFSEKERFVHGIKDMFDESLSIKFSPLYLDGAEPSLEWCTNNNGLWNENNTTCYFENQEDLDSGMNSLMQYEEINFGRHEN